jgi:hypothetical protein
MNPTPDPEDFRISMSAHTANRVRLLFDEALLDGRDNLFLDSLRTVELRLRKDPVTFGEELYDLREHHVTVKIAIRLPIAVEFGLHLARRTVMIRSFSYLPFAG